MKTNLKFLSNLLISYPSPSPRLPCNLKHLTLASTHTWLTSHTWKLMRNTADSLSPAAAHVMSAVSLHINDAIPRGV